MSKINESQKRRLAVLAGLKNRDAAKLEEAKEKAERRKRIAEQVESILGDDDADDMEGEELEEGGKHTKKGSAFIKAKRKANMDMGLKEMDMGMEEEGDEMDMDGMDDMGGDMEMGGDDMEMGDDDGMGPGAEMGGGGDEELATRIITRVVDAIKAELGVDVTVDSGAPQPNVPGAGMDDMGSDDMGMGHEEPDADDMGGPSDGDEDNEDEMLHEEDDSYKAGGKASKPKVAKVDHAHPDHKLSNKGGLKEARNRLTKEIAAEIAKETLMLIKSSAAKKKEKK